MTFDRRELVGHPRDALLLAARLLLAFLFVHEGVFLVLNFDGAASAMAKMGVPAMALIATIALQVAAGAAIALELHARIGAVALAFFCLSTAFMFHNHFAVRDELLHFEKDLAIAGGLFVLAVQGGGEWSIDALARALAWALRHS